MWLKLFEDLYKDLFNEKNFKDIEFSPVGTDSKFLLLF